MAQLGYALSSEEHTSNDLVRNAARAEEVGFSFAMISDHYHPWVSAQGHSPFVWSVIGGIAQVTQKLELGTGVTAPIMRIHPAIIAQAVATAGSMMEGRFFLGVGTGENLNEHVLGDRWPPHDIRLSMLEEAVEVMRLLWSGETESFWGEYYTVEDARVFDVPDPAPRIMVAAAGPITAEAAGLFGDGFISTSPKAELVKEFQNAGGSGKPCYGQVTVCWAASEEEAKRTVHKIWPNAGLTGELSQELRTIAHFEQAAELVTEETATKKMPVGPNPEKYWQAIQEYFDAGFDHVYLHQIGPDQEGFFRFAEQELLPRMRKMK